MAEMAMVFNPLAPIASLRAPPSAPTPLPVITTINGNGRIIPAPTFVRKGLPAAIAAKPIPRRYTGSTETRPGIWVNAKKACNLADHMDVTPMVSTLKRLETHVYNVIHPPQDHSLKWWLPSPDFVFTEDDFPYLPGSGTPSKRQGIDDGTISLGSPMLPPDFAGDFDTDYFPSVPNFLDHKPNANYIEQSLVWRCNLTSPQYFGLHKKKFLLPCTCRPLWPSSIRTPYGGAIQFHWSKASMTIGLWCFNALYRPMIWLSRCLQIGTATDDSDG